MAKIELTAFVEPWTKNSEQHPAWGMKTAETHRKKDGDDWVDNGRTFRTVKVAYGVDLDLTQFRKGDRVNIVGTEVTESREHDGKKYYDLVVKATSVELATKGAGSGGSNGRSPVGGTGGGGGSSQGSYGAQNGGDTWAPSAPAGETFGGFGDPTPF